MKVTVKVPATTANMGPGFDCLGMALPFYNYVTIEETILPGTGVEINLISEDDMIDTETMSVPTDENNVLYKAIELLFNSIGHNPSELKITIKTGIPIARGLGSSASVIVGGLVAANKLLGNPADEAALLSIATEVEGHPDNITPALVGGFTFASKEDSGEIVYRKMDWPSDWKITVCIPNYELATEIARSVLPKEVPIQDASFNIRRAIMFMNAVNSQDSELMKLALEDKIHQPYRTKLVPGLAEIKEALRHEENVLGVVLSGAGPSVIIFSTNNAEEKIKEIVSSVWDNLNVKSEIKTVKPELNGAKIEE